MGSSNTPSFHPFHAKFNFKDFQMFRRHEMPSKPIGYKAFSVLLGLIHLMY